MKGLMSSASLLGVSMSKFLTCWTRGLFFGVLVLSLSALAGCGGSSQSGKGNIEGTVKIDGVTANSGNVVFTVGQESISGAIQPDGTYRAVAVPIGEAKVTVTGLPPKPRTDPKTAPKGGSDAPGTPTVSDPIPIPAKYAKAESSGLTFTVKSGTNTFPIELTK
jgi:hypothetical protein